MKAEQRKELETNTLADKMGHMMQRVKSSQRRTFLFYFVATLIVVFGLWIGYRWYVEDTQARSMQWLMLYDGSFEHIRELAAKEENVNTAAGKAARFQIAWILYWDDGVKKAGADQRGAIQSLQTASSIYQKLIEECQGDKVFEPQAILGLAVTQETLAVQSRGNLKKAKENYQALVDKHAESAEAKFAQQRLDILKDERKSAELSATYGMLQDLLRIPQAQQGMPGLHNQQLQFPPVEPK